MEIFYFVRSFGQSFWNPSGESHDLKSAILIVGMTILLFTGPAIWGCSSSPKSSTDPSKQEIQGDADRFFNKMEKEEAKKEAKEAGP